MAQSKFLPPPPGSELERRTPKHRQLEALQAMQDYYKKRKRSPYSLIPGESLESIGSSILDPGIAEANKPEYLDWLKQTQTDRYADEAETENQRRAEFAAGLPPRPPPFPPAPLPPTTPDQRQQRDELIGPPEPGMTPASDIPQTRMGKMGRIQGLDAQEYLADTQKPWPSAPLPPQPQGPTGTAGGDIGAGLGPGRADPRLASLGPMPGLQTPPPPPGSEVWEQEASREKDLGQMGMAREISEGLKLAGRSLVGLSGAQIPEGDDTARDIRGLIAKKEDEISPQMRQMLASKGLVIPEGISMDKLIKMGIVPQHFAGQRYAAGIGARQTEGGLERTSREGIAAAGVTSREKISTAGIESRERLTQAQVTESKRRYEQDREESSRRWEVDREMAEKKFGRLADKELAEIDQMEVSIEGMKAIAAERIEKGYYTGPLDSRGAKIGAWLGFGVSPESIEWRRKVISQLNLYIKEMTGAQLSAAEAKRLMLGLPTDKDQEEFFDAKIKGTIAELERKRDSFLRTRRWAGKDTEAFDKVEYKVGDRRAMVPGGDVPGFEEEYPSALRQRRGPLAPP